MQEKYMHGKNAKIKSSEVIESKTLCPPPVRLLYLAEEIYHMVGLAEIVLNIIVLGGDSQLDELLLKSPGLLEETMHLSFNLHTA